MIEDIEVAFITSLALQNPIKLYMCFKQWCFPPFSKVDLCFRSIHAMPIATLIHHWDAVRVYKWGRKREFFGCDVPWSCQMGGVLCLDAYSWKWC